MSWQAYVENLVGSGQVSQAAVWGLNGDVWATSPGFQKLNDIIATFSKPDRAFENDIKIAGVKYFAEESDGDSIKGQQLRSGVAIYKTNQVVLLGVYKDGMSASSCNSIVSALASHLISSGY